MQVYSLVINDYPNLMAKSTQNSFTSPKTTLLLYHVSVTWGNKCSLITLDNMIKNQLIFLHIDITNAINLWINVLKINIGFLQCWITPAVKYEHIFTSSANKLACYQNFYQMDQYLPNHVNNCLNKLITVTQVSSGLIINVQNQTISEPKHFEWNKAVSVFLWQEKEGCIQLWWRYCCQQQQHPDRSWGVQQASVGGRGNGKVVENSWCQKSLKNLWLWTDSRRWAGILDLDSSCKNRLQSAFWIFK